MKLTRPVLIYDGDCGFCKTWIDRWKNLTIGKVDYEPYQAVGKDFAQIKPEDFEKAVHLVEPNGEISKAAQAVFKVLSYSPSIYRFGYFFYKKAPLFPQISETLYKFIAGHRKSFSWLTWVLWGDKVRIPTYLSASNIFIKVISIVFFFAFLSTFQQMDLIFSSKGISAASDFLRMVKSGEGDLGYYLYPTLAWLNSSDTFLKLLCVGGMAASVLSLFNFFPAIFLLFCWAAYLSLSIVGGTFFYFQWDTLLLEAGFLSVFLSASKYHPRFSFLMRFLLFKLLFLSGMAKLKSGDPTWHDLTALSHHFETQPLPTFFAWYAHNLPAVVLKVLSGATLFIEIIVPFFFFGPRRIRMIGFYLFTAFQLGILMTGNYCFFNVLALGLGLFLLDDAFFERRQTLTAAFANKSKWSAFALPLLVIQILCIVSSSMSWPVYSIISPLRTFNRYALFSVMTTYREEVVFEGSSDGMNWKEYDFYYKPGDLSKRPPFNIPLQPRIDWQMWFATFTSFNQNPWMQPLMLKLLKNDPDALKLFRTNPFPDHPPKYVRAVMWKYDFTNYEEKKSTGNWWKRENPRIYSPVLSITHVE